MKLRLAKTPKLIGEMPLIGRLDDAVERDEQAYRDLLHDSFSHVVDDFRLRPESYLSKPSKEAKQ